ncbi:hypothetical protein KYB31_22785 [Clostridium felsineum]|uniref:hypothetical protein n=1 Tax=Clostridium felsineum TaxID=36839 RepID=UPI00214D3B4B|nr:hypothetical protein [Clostridium felsineum]MCR3761804.1 hypothetical protein [Clostridium felsineum]
MNKEYKEKFPNWTKDNKKYYMCLTDDLDSLFSCILLNKIKGYKISHFYSFNSLYRLSSYKNNSKIIAIDMETNIGKAWSNHVNNVYNCNAANLNVIDRIDENTYFKKYSGSTLLQIISYYNWDISSLTEEAKMILLAIDSTYLGYYLKQYPLPQVANKHYLCDILDLKELYKLQESHTKEDFEKLQKKYNLKKKIFVNEEGKLKTSIDLKALSKIFKFKFRLTEENFELIKTFERAGVSTKHYTNKIKKLEGNGHKIFTQAQTNKNFIKLSYY